MLATIRTEPNVEEFADEDEMFKAATIFVNSLGRANLAWFKGNLEGLLIVSDGLRVLNEALEKRPGPTHRVTD